MNTYPHDLNRLAHYGLRGNAQHAKELRQRRIMVRMGWIMVGALMLMGASRCAHAYEPSNAADVKGRFTLVVGGTSIDDGYHLDKENRPRKWLQPFIVPGFTSYHLCRAAGMEMQARFNTDGYTLDFVCLLQGK